MIKAIILSLIIGVVYGQFFLEPSHAVNFSYLSDIALVVLMFSVGISVGANKQVFSKIKEHHIKILIIPIGIILGSIAGGFLCSILMDMPLNVSVAITSGLGWYSLSGVLITDLAGADLGTIAFLANLFREILSFMLIPIVAKYCNHYTAIAPAAATSEDTTLPVLIKYTSEEVVIMAVINGVICYMMVPVLTNLFYRIL
ncbi:lysine exporter LysO family protein [Zhenhengia yiwuensis]|uniref:Lysine exporter LysO family protein n=1 Tax=Zhenhengia yiwuensis TaxID=2763666 RepID=A0A926EHQ6_9FIRM|nr:lysine exporter LysO family protein [Zhenhengia yiwuensis]MBC8578432.1 lysine exporter LysO family protein [Zhenhengia yiwuensis]